MKNTIYIGATLIKEGLMHNELFNARPTELIGSLKKKYPLIEMLFVSATDYVAAVADMETDGSALSEALQQTKLPPIKIDE